MFVAGLLTCLNALWYPERPCLPLPLPLPLLLPRLGSSCLHPLHPASSPLPQVSSKHSASEADRRSEASRSAAVWIGSTTQISGCALPAESSRGSGDFTPAPFTSSSVAPRNYRGWIFFLKRDRSKFVSRAENRSCTTVTQ